MDKEAINDDNEYSLSVVMYGTTAEVSYYRIRVKR